jgi:acetate kinase
MFDMATKEVLGKGGMEKIGLSDTFLKHQNKTGEKFKFEGKMDNHVQGIQFILEKLVDKEAGSLESLDEIQAVGHRVLHGGQIFSDSVLLTPDVLAKLEELVPLGPLHMPHNLKGISAIEKKLSGIPQVAVFDTAFHQTMPKHAYMYALPYEMYEEKGIRRYGFHGTSHKYLAKRTAELLNKKPEEINIITCHLGNGASVAAVEKGKCVDTSMGLTPAEGLIMGTRSGDLDPAILIELMREGMTADEINDLINKKSGVLGISGSSSDMRDIEEASWVRQEERATLALDMYFYRVKKYIGSYAAAMGGVDAIVFSGGVGENGPETREAICQGLEFMGVEFDKKVNDKVRGKELVISKENSRVKVLIVPTDEELMIAEDTHKLVK